MYAEYQRESVIENMKAGFLGTAQSRCVSRSRGEKRVH